MGDEDRKIQEMQLLERNLQNLLLQKQAFQAELSETQAALKELESAGDDVFKIVGQLMIKTEKSKTKDELSNREKLLNLRINSIEKQEDSLAKKLNELREDVMGSSAK